MTEGGSRRGLTALLALFIASRALVLLSGLWGTALLPPGRAAQPGNVQRPWYAPLPLEIGARWDAEWYLLIAEEGYHLEKRMEGRRVHYAPADATGFFPLYPLLVRGLGTALAAFPGTSSLPTFDHATGQRLPHPEGGTPFLLAALLISNAALLGAVLLLYRQVLATGHGGEPVTQGAALF
ncbi:MAG TPA: hypothetical protein VNI57_00915, partial [Candidatus Saccharimonadales bacterium]|nr:hypothetical protein [Candidatus Saccharimonadales bacterium]